MEGAPCARRKGLGAFLASVNVGGVCIVPEENVVVVGRKSLPDYVLEAILLFNEGYDEVIIRGQGPNVGKAVDLYNALRRRLQGGIELVGVKIDSIERGRRLIPIIEIRVRRTIA